MKRLDFSFETKLETMESLSKIKAKKLLKQRLDFPLENKFKTMDRLAKMHGQKIVATTVRFSTRKRDSNYG